MAEGHRGCWNASIALHPILLSISLPTDARPGTHSLTPLSLPLSPLPSKLCDYRCKQMALRAASPSGEVLGTRHRATRTPWSGSHTGPPFMSFGNCPLFPEVSVSPSIKWKEAGSTCSEPQTFTLVPRSPWKFPQQAGRPHAKLGAEWQKV